MREKKKYFKFELSVEKSNGYFFFPSFLKLNNWHQNISRTQSYSLTLQLSGRINITHTTVEELAAISSGGPLLSLALGNLRWEDSECRANIYDIMKPCLKESQKKERLEWRQDVPGGGHTGIVRSSTSRFYQHKEGRGKHKEGEALRMSECTGAGAEWAQDV